MRIGRNWQTQPEAFLSIRIQGESVRAVRRTALAQQHKYARGSGRHGLNSVDFGGSCLNICSELGLSTV